MNVKSSIQNSFKTFDFSLYGTLVLISFLPIFYTTVRIHFLGNLPNDWGFNIASQLAWVSIGYEVIQEAVILPLFYLISRTLPDKAAFSNRIRTGLTVSFILFLGMTLFVLIFADPILTFMGQKPEIKALTVSYIRFEAIAIQISVLFRFITIVLIILKQNRKLLILLVLQMIFIIISDTLLVSSVSFSLKLGVNGIAIGNIIGNVVLVVFGIVFLQQENIQLLSKTQNDYTWLKEWGKIGGLSGLESFVRNVAFTVMILRMVNMVQQQGTFWVANNFIWGWLLLPILALGEIIKRNTAEDNNGFARAMPAYMTITILICALWFILMPTWDWFIRDVMNITDYQSVVSVVRISLIYYVIFAVNNVIDSVFYGLGRTDLMLYQSLLVNTLYYGGLYIAYRTGIFIPTLNRIAIMFGIGMAIDSVITVAMYVVLSRGNRLIKNK